MGKPKDPPTGNENQVKNVFHLHTKDYCGYEVTANSDDDIVMVRSSTTNRT